MRFYILTSIILLLTQAAYALDVVYPKKNTVTIQSPSTFFVGSASVNTPLKIKEELYRFTHQADLQRLSNLNTAKTDL